MLFSLLHILSAHYTFFLCFSIFFELSFLFIHYSRLFVCIGTSLSVFYLFAGFCNIISAHAHVSLRLCTGST